MRFPSVRVIFDGCCGGAAVIICIVCNCMRMTSVSDCPKSHSDESEFTTISTTYLSNGLMTSEVTTFDSIVLILISFTGILANSLIIVSHAITRKLRSKTNALVVNLAFADVCACFCLPAVAVFLLIETNDFGSNYISPRVIVVGLINMCIECGVLTVTLIAVNRFILITKTNRNFHKMFRKKMLRIWFGILWLVSFCVAAIPIFTGFSNFGVFSNLECERNEGGKHSHLIYDIIFVIFLIPIPLAVSLYCYISIYKHIQKHNKQFHHRRETAVTVDETSASSR